jgi:hypothetical protein
VTEFSHPLRHDPGRNDPVSAPPDKYWDSLRQAMGQSRRYVERINLQAAIPHGELASTGFCLADPGNQYLVFLPNGGEATVDLSAAKQPLKAEWVRVQDGTVTHASPVQGGTKASFKASFPGDAVLYLRSD